MPWPPTPPVRVPPPPVNDGPPRFVAWLISEACAGCGGRVWWRDQYLVNHCGHCSPPLLACIEIPPPPVVPVEENREGKEVVQLRLFRLV